MVGNGADRGERTMLDKRTTPRREIERTARIDAGNGPPIECALSDVSQTGARLTVQETAAIPDEFMLLLRDDLRRWCRVIRRSQQHIGVRFVAAPDSAEAGTVQTEGQTA